MKRMFLAVAVVLLAKPAQAQGYTINGMPLDFPTASYLSSLGLPPGDYWISHDGYWGVMNDPTPLGHLGGTQQGYYDENGSFHYFSGGFVMGGSGQVNPDGSSSYYNPNLGTSFGADGDGCYYVGDWSNC